MTLEDKGIRECPFCYEGITTEDYLYLLYLIRNGAASKLDDLTHGRVKLPPYKKRTREDVFSVFGGDVNYQFDIDTMA